jgi:hypothetical protein
VSAACLSAADALFNRGVEHDEQAWSPDRKRSVGVAAFADCTLVVESYSADADPAMRELVAKLAD